MTAAQALKKLLAKLKLKSLDVPVMGDRAEEDAIVYLLQALQSTNIAALTIRTANGEWFGDGLYEAEQKAAALESFVSNTQCLGSLTFENLRPEHPVSTKYFDAIINGMKCNKHKCIKHLSFDGLALVSFEELDDLFLTGASKIHLESCELSDLHRRRDSRRPENTFQDLWDLCHVEELTIEDAQFGGTGWCFSRFMTKIGNLPFLTELRLFNVDLVESGNTREVTEAVVTLLEQGLLRRLEFHFPIDIPVLCRHLQDNTSLVDLCLGFIFQNECRRCCELLDDVLRDHNVTLESLALTHDNVEYKTPGQKASYFMSLNRLGRRKMRCEEVLPVSFLDIILAALSEEDSNMVVPFVYGLLRESPSKWTSFAQTRKHEGGTRKRKLKSLQAE
eukprot:Sro1648_g288450.1 n/a (391) ;mRNA; r:5098-6270